MFITGTKTNHTIILNNDHKFGNTNAPGAQHKGNAIIDGKDMFIKADDINPLLGTWEPRYDYEHSSITEAIVSKFIANLDDDFNSVQYEYVAIQHGNMTTTGTISENYLKENELESMLSNHDERYATLINIDEYREQIEDVKSENRFENLVKLAVQNNITKNDAEDFLIKQAAFDMLTGNVDRLGNPSNFIFVYNQETKQGRMVNFDYGRCLPTPTWVQRSEENFKDEYIDEDKEDLAKSWIQGNKSILSGKTLEEQKQFLKDHGFTGFHLNVGQFEQDLDELKEIFKGSLFENYTKMKVETFKEVVRQNLNTLIFDTSLSKDDFLAITETRQHVTNI